MALLCVVCVRWRQQYAASRNRDNRIDGMSNRQAFQSDRWHLPLDVDAGIAPAATPFNLSVIFNSSVKLTVRNRAMAWRVPPCLAAVPLTLTPLVAQSPVGGLLDDASSVLRRRSVDCTARRRIDIRRATAPCQER